jgi:hypothetical protein
MRSLVVLFFVIHSTAVCQVGSPPPTHEKKSFVDSLGNYYQQASLPVYLLVANSPQGSPVPLKSVNSPEIFMEGHGVHAFKHINHITQKFDEYQIFADGLAPVSVASLTKASAFVKDAKTFFNTGLQVTVTSKDEMSGIDAVYHSINGAPFEKYKAFTIDTPGSYHYRFYAVDKTGNAETVKLLQFNVDNSAPSSFHNIVGISSQQVISTNSSIYLTISDTLSGIAKSFFKFDKEPFKAYAGGTIAFQYLKDGEHTLTYFSTDNVGNKENEKSVTFYLDKSAPIMSADVLGDKFIVGERVYFSGRTKLKLTAVDNKSGIKEIMYSINDESFIPYQDPFYLPNRSGIHNVRFHAVDNTNNATKDDFEHSVGVIYVDLTGPSIFHTYTGPNFVKADTTFVSPKTTITLSGNDPEAGLKKLTYSLVEGGDEIPYAKPVATTNSGFHKLTYFGYDNVNNKNTRETMFVVDTKGPTITHQFSVSPNAEGKYPSYTNIYLAAMDAEVGADQIRFSINGTKEQLYVAPLKGFAKNKEYTIKVTATDLLGNTSQTTIAFKTDKF